MSRWLGPNTGPSPRLAFLCRGCWRTRLILGWRFAFARTFRHPLRHG